MTLKHCLTIAVMCAATARAADAPSTTAEIAALKQELQEQRQQIAELRAAIAEQHRILETISTPRATSPTIEPIRFTSPVPSAAPQPSTASEKASPLQVQIGSAYITPVGFMDFTSVTRSRNTGAGIGSSFGGVPFKNTVQGNLPETRFSAQNSRIGFRADAIVKGAHVIGYLESDFLGFVPANAAVTTNGVSNRMRLYWADVRMGKVEFLAGQSWTMLTPNRKGISAIPSDLFYSQDVDVNYQAGLTWSRDPGFRILYHPTETATLGLSFENPEQYIGGSSGASLVTLPSALSTQYALQLNNGNTTLSAPALHPDIIAKIAFDPKLPSGRALHFEIAGVERTFHVYNQTLDRHFTTAGGAGSINVNFEIVKNRRLLTNNYYGSGGGRYIFGQAPDLIVRSDGSLSPIHSGSTVSGFELGSEERRGGE